MMTKDYIKVVYFLIMYVKYATPKKITNWIYNWIEFQLKVERIKSVPRSVFIDISNVCNLRCPLCPTGKTSPQTKAISTFEQFKKYFDPVKEYLFVINLHNWGEPFLCKDIFKIVNYCHENNVGVIIHSNLNIVTDEMIGNIVSSKIDYIHVSADGVTQENYEFYRKNGDINNVLNIVKKIHDTKKAEKSFFPILNWGFLVNNQNKDEVIIAKKIFKEKGFQLISVHLLHNISEHIHEYYKFDENYYQKYVANVVTREELAQDSSKIHCPFLWSGIVINPSDTFAPCLLVYKDKDMFEKIEQQTMSDLYNSEIMIESRKIFTIPGYRPKVKTPCSPCIAFRKPMK